MKPITPLTTIIISIVEAIGDYPIVFVPDLAYDRRASANRCVAITLLHKNGVSYKEIARALKYDRKLTREAYYYHERRLTNSRDYARLFQACSAELDIVLEKEKTPGFSTGKTADLT